METYTQNTRSLSLKKTRLPQLNILEDIACAMLYVHGNVFLLLIMVSHVYKHSLSLSIKTVIMFMTCNLKSDLGGSSELRKYLCN